MVADFTILASPRQLLISGYNNWWNGNGFKLQTSKCLFRNLHFRLCQYLLESMLKNETVTGFYIWLTTSQLCQEFLNDYWCSVSSIYIIWRKVQFLPARFFWNFWWRHTGFLFEEWRLKWIHEKRTISAPPSIYPFPKYSCEMEGAAGSGSSFCRTLFESFLLMI